MNAKIEQVEEENIEATDEIEEVEPKKETTGSNQKKKQVYTSEEHTAEIKRIVAKEKAAWKRGVDEDLTAKDEKLQRQNDIIQKQVDILKPDLQLPAKVLEKIFEGKDAEESLEIILDMMEDDGKERIKPTPKGQKKSAEFKSNFTPNL